MEIKNNFLPLTEKLLLELSQKHQNLEPVIRQLKSWHKYKTITIKADIIILGNETLLTYFRKINNTSINKNIDILEYQTSDLIAFHTSHLLYT